MPPGSLPALPRFAACAAPRRAALQPALHSFGFADLLDCEDDELLEQFVSGDSLSALSSRRSSTSDASTASSASAESEE